DPSNTRFNWASQPTMNIVCLDELEVDNTTESKRDEITKEYCHVLYLSGEYGPIDYTPNPIRWYGYYFLNDDSDGTSVYTHESNMRTLKHAANNTWKITKVGDLTERTVELPVIAAARSQNMTQSFLLNDGTQDVVSQITCVLYIDKYMCATLLLDDISDERFANLQGLYSTTGTLRQNHRPVFQWTRAIAGEQQRKTSQESVYLYFLSRTSEWAIGSTMGDGEDGVICRVVDPVDDPSLISREWNCLDNISNTMIQVESLQFLFYHEEMALDKVTEMTAYLTTEVTADMTTEMAVDMATENKADLTTDRTVDMATEIKVDKATENKVDLTTKRTVDMATE
ncbi:unnamed protein product, partial [Owenia fusiformis]